MFALDPAGWMNFFFKLLNLLALFALFAYIFKQYLLEGFRNKIIKEKQMQEGMQLKILILEQKGKELVHVTFTQEQYAHYLLEKADQWRQISEFDQGKKQHEFQALRNASIARTELQAKNIQTSQLEKTVIPTALQDAQLRLTQIYGDEKRGNEYMQNLLTLMKKSL